MDLKDIPNSGCAPSATCQGITAFCVCRTGWGTAWRCTVTLFWSRCGTSFPKRPAVWVHSTLIAVWQTTGNNGMGCCVWRLRRHSREPLGYSSLMGRTELGALVCRDSLSTCVLGSGTSFCGMIGIAVGLGEWEWSRIWCLADPILDSAVLCVCLIMANYLGSAPQFPNLKHLCYYTLFIYSSITADLKYIRSALVL